MRYILAAFALVTLAACGSGADDRNVAASTASPDEAVGSEGEIMADADLANEAAAAEAADAAAGGNMNAADVSAADNNAASNQ